MSHFISKTPPAIAKIFNKVTVIVVATSGRICSVGIVVYIWETSFPAHINVINITDTVKTIILQGSIFFLLFIITHVKL